MWRAVQKWDVNWVPLWNWCDGQRLLEYLISMYLSSSLSPSLPSSSSPLFLLSPLPPLPSSSSPLFLLSPLPPLPSSPSRLTYLATVTQVPNVDWANATRIWRSKSILGNEICRLAVVYKLPSWVWRGDVGFPSCSLCVGFCILH